MYKFRFVAIAPLTRYVTEINRHFIQIFKFAMLRVIILFQIKCYFVCYEYNKGSTYIICKYIKCGLTRRRRRKTTMFISVFKIYSHIYKRRHSICLSRRAYGLKYKYNFWIKTFRYIGEEGVLCVYNKNDNSRARDFPWITRTSHPRILFLYKRMINILKQ